MKSLDESPPEGIKVGVNDDDFSTIFADIEGPGMQFSVCQNFMSFETDCNSGIRFPLHAAGTPYENGVFRMKLLLSHDFPHSPPKGWLVILYGYYYFLLKSVNCLRNLGLFTMWMF